MSVEVLQFLPDTLRDADPFKHTKRCVHDLQGARGRIAKMSAEVVDSNPYSRLMALQRMGIVQDYERIRDKTVRPFSHLCCHMHALSEMSCMSAA